jgi:hypothetical protein
LITTGSFFVILGPQSIAYFDNGKRQRRISAINDGSSSGIVVDENEYTITLPAGEKL